MLYLPGMALWTLLMPSDRTSAYKLRLCENPTNFYLILISNFTWVKLMWLLWGNIYNSIFLKEEFGSSIF
jgi:hypothetical protein